MKTFLKLNTFTGAACVAMALWNPVNVPVLALAWVACLILSLFVYARAS